MSTDICGHLKVLHSHCLSVPGGVQRSYKLELHSCLLPHFPTFNLPVSSPCLADYLLSTLWTLGPWGLLTIACCGKFSRILLQPVHCSQAHNGNSPHRALNAYQFLALQFCLSSAPMVFAKVMTPVFALLRSQGILFVGYLLARFSGRIIGSGGQCTSVFRCYGVSDRC